MNGAMTEIIINSVPATIAEMSLFGKCNNTMLLEKVQKDKRLKTNQRIQYHLDKLREPDLITITHGWQYLKDGKTKVDYKKRTIQITVTGKFYAQFPDLIGRYN